MTAQPTLQPRGDRPSLLSSINSPLLLRARVVLPVCRRPIHDGAVLISGRRIAAVGPWLMLVAVVVTVATGVDYVHVLDSGKPGPNVMVQALTHGNEFCGAIALKMLFDERIRPERGKLTLAFANVAAFARFDFDPDTDIRLSPSGCWKWSSDKTDMHRFVNDYFRSRYEAG